MPVGIREGGVKVKCSGERGRKGGGKGGRKGGRESVREGRKEK